MRLSEGSALLCGLMADPYIPRKAAQLILFIGEALRIIGLRIIGLTHSSNPLD